MSAEDGDADRRPPISRPQRQNEREPVVEHRDVDDVDGPSDVGAGGPEAMNADTEHRAATLRQRLKSNRRAGGSPEEWVPRPSRTATADVPGRPEAIGTSEDEFREGTDGSLHVSQEPRPRRDRLRRERSPEHRSSRSERTTRTSRMSVGGSSSDEVAEDQTDRSRRAQRIEGGGIVAIDGVIVELLDWSSGGLSVGSDAQPHQVGDVAALDLEIDLGDYAVTVALVGEVVNRGVHRTGWRFRDPTETQRQVLRSLTHTSVHGKTFAAPRPPSPDRDNARALSERGASPGAGGIRTAGSSRGPRGLAGFSPLAAIMSLPFNAAVIAFVAGCAILVMQGDDTPATVPGAPGRAQYAAVAVERVALEADEPGLILQWERQPGEALRKGEALVALADESGTGALGVISSPCRCVLSRIVAQKGQRVSRGQVVAVLYPSGVDGHVQAIFAAGSAPNVGDIVDVELPYSGSRVAGMVQRVGRPADPAAYIGLPADLMNDADGVYARIDTADPLPPALAGSPVIVTAAPDR